MSASEQEHFRALHDAFVHRVHELEDVKVARPRGHVRSAKDGLDPHPEQLEETPLQHELEEMRHYEPPEGFGPSSLERQNHLPERVLSRLEDLELLRAGRRAGLREMGIRQEAQIATQASYQREFFARLFFFINEPYATITFNGMPYDQMAADIAEKKMTYYSARNKSVNVVPRYRDAAEAPAFPLEREGFFVPGKSTEVVLPDVPESIGKRLAALREKVQKGKRSRKGNGIDATGKPESNPPGGRKD